MAIAFKVQHNIALHCDTEELLGKVMLVFLLNNSQSSCLKHLLEPLHTSTAERNIVDRQHAVILNTRVMVIIMG